MIDTDKYEPTQIDWILHKTREHSSDGWWKLGASLIELSDDDRELVANAPILRAELKRLRGIAKTCLEAIEAGGDIRSGTIEVIEHNLKEMIE